MQGEAAARLCTVIDMKIIAITDIHSKTDSIHKLKDHLERCDLVLIAGDLTQFGSADDAAAVLGVVRAYNERILAVAGNIDRPEVARYLEEEEISLHGRGKVIGEAGFFGVGGSNTTPLGTPNEIADSEIYPLLEKGWREIKGARFKILVSHPPPRSTKVDMTHSGFHAGSESLRRFIEERRPDLCIAGHIHESRGEDGIGGTSILNPGPLFDGGWAEIEISPEGIKAALRSTGY
jgi:Icc-related predicted phosphoesterase